MGKLLGIIIPVYKTPEKYLRACFDSLMSQRSDDFDVIVIDDGSPDKCGKICDEYATKDERFKVVHQTNSGVSAARNKGLDFVDTEWVTFIDPDDWIELDYIETIYDYIKQGDDIDVFLFDYIQEFTDKSVTKELLKESQKLGDELVQSIKLAPFNHLFINGNPVEYETNVIWNKIYRTKLIKEKELRFDIKARKGQDVIFNAEVLLQTVNFYYIHNALYHYRYLQESVTNRYNPKAQYYNEVAFENYERIIEKYNLPVAYKEAYYARVVTRVFSTMRLYYFHKENKAHWRDICRQLDGTLECKPYKEALNKVRYSILTKSQKVFVYFLKHHQYEVLWVLVNARQMAQKIAGKRLQ